MSSVTQRIREIKQPKGGYINPSQFAIHKIDDRHLLAETENIHASIIGLTVDYLTRFAMGSKPLEAFEISWRGAEIAEKVFGQKKCYEKSAQIVGQNKSH